MDLEREDLGMEARFNFLLWYYILYIYIHIHVYIYIYYYYINALA